ncbi:MAG: hypothetical protein PHN82_03320 [bacterium]|nr:hypothetical protein [bacterium]
MRLPFVVLLISFSLFCLTNNVVDPDLWGHVRFGLDILRDGAIPRFDPYSYTARGLPWINHEWLAEVTFAVLFRHLGGGGIVILRLAAGLAVMGIMISNFIRRAAPPWNLIAAGLAISVASYGLCFRPQMFSYLFFTLLLLALARKPAGWFLLVPAVFLAWANFHGGFPMGLAALAVWAAFECADALRRGEARGALVPVAVLAVSAAATLVNPYGIGLWRFLASTLALRRPYLPEWAPIRPGDIDFVDFKALLVFFIVAVAASRASGPWRFTCIAAAAAAAAFAHNRHMPFFAIAASFAMPEPLAAMLGRLGRGGEGPSRPAPGRKAAWLLAAVVAAAIPLARGRSAFSLVVPADRYPVAAVRWMGERGIAGNCAVLFDWGEYLIWHLGGTVLVSVDGRYDTVYPERVIDDNFRFFFAGERWWNLIAGYPTEIILLHPENPVAPVIARLPEWSQAFRSGTAVVFLKRGVFPEMEQEGEGDVGMAGVRSVPFP